jgi:hypothetical protein
VFGRQWQILQAETKLKRGLSPGALLCFGIHLREQWRIHRTGRIRGTQVEPDPSSQARMRANKPAGGGAPPHGKETARKENQALGGEEHGARRPTLARLHWDDTGPWRRRTLVRGGVPRNSPKSARRRLFGENRTAGCGAREEHEGVRSEP